MKQFNFDTLSKTPSKFYRYTGLEVGEFLDLTDKVQPLWERAERKRLKIIMFSFSTKTKLRKVAKKYGIKLILMFGSQVNKKTHQMSDIDIGVLLEENALAFKNFFSLLDDFQKIFPEKKLDLAIINNADPLFLKKILENCQLLFGKEKELSKLKLYSFHQFCDYQKYFTLEKEFAHRFLKQFK